MPSSHKIRPIVVSLTAIPSRFPNLHRKVESLLRQSVQAQSIDIYIPKSYRRFPNHQAQIPSLPESVQIIEVDQDYGPATKLLPALDRYHDQDIDILICDDDRLQDKYWIERFQEARIERPNDIICERGWNIADRFGIEQSEPLAPRARLSSNRGRTIGYKAIRALSLGLLHPKRAVYETGGYVDVFEGFLGALIPPMAMPKEAWDIPDILWTVDDVWLSGMAKTNGIGVWAHGKPRPVYSNGHWDKVDALTNFVEQGADREKADRMCVEYMRSKHGVWV